MSAWTVWVDGGEVNSHYLTLSAALKVAEVWRGLGYAPIVEQLGEELRACNHGGDFLGIRCAECNLLVGNCCGVADNSGLAWCAKCDNTTELKGA